MGTQKYKTTTWKPPNGLSVAKARKLAEAEAYQNLSGPHSRYRKRTQESFLKIPITQN